METYRSGHNEPHSKCGHPSGCEGSNPSVSVSKKPKPLLRSFFVLRNGDDGSVKKAEAFAEVFFCIWETETMAPSKKPVA